MSRSAAQLPPGRHGLTREQVLASQRGRMLAAMADAVSAKGYAATTVADVIRGAGVSRETFYQHFADKAACFHAAFEGVSDLVAREITGAIGTAGGSGDRFARLDASLAAYLDTLAAEPALARTFLIEVYGAGPDAVTQRVQVLERFTDLVVALVEPADERERFACEALVAAVSSLVTMRVAARRHAELPALREPLLALARQLLGEGSA